MSRLVWRCRLLWKGLGEEVRWEMALFYDFPVVYASGLGFSMRLLSKNNGCKYEI